MEYKKIIIPLILAIFLLSITSVCASEIDNASSMELWGLAIINLF